MSTTAVGDARPSHEHITFARVVHSEWIKFVTVRSTVWTLSTTLLLMVGLSLLIAAATSGDGGPAGGPGGGPGGPDGVGPTALQIVTAGYVFAQMAVAVLGVLVITGEYSTGMIRSTLTAVPTRLPVLAAKALVLTAATFSVGFVGVLLATAVTAPLLADDPIDLGDAETWRILIGTGLYLAAIALLAFGLGGLIRHTAGGVTAILGTILLLPLLALILGNWLTWVADAAPYLPAAAGERLLVEPLPAGTPAIEGVTLLGPWQGFAILLAYVAVALVGAAVSLRRRDA